MWRKAFDKMRKKAFYHKWVQHPFMIKTLSKVGVEGAYLNIMKATDEKPTGNIIFNRQKLKCSH